LDSLVQPQWSPLFRTDTQQSAAESGWYPPVEGFLFLCEWS
jgi:hypothetical protein